MGQTGIPEWKEDAVVTETEMSHKINNPQGPADLEKYREKGMLLGSEEVKGYVFGWRLTAGLLGIAPVRKV